MGIPFWERNINRKRNEKCKDSMIDKGKKMY